MSKKVTDLTLLATPDSTDVIPVVDVSANTTKKTTVGGLLLDGSVATAKIADGAVTAAKVTVSGCDLTHSTTQSIANSTIQAVVFNTEAFDTDGYHSTSVNTSRITVPAAGKYLFTANLHYSGNNGNGSRFVFFGINGDTGHRYGIDSTLPHSVDAVGCSGIVVLSLAAGDYVEAFAYQSSGGALNLIGDTQAGGTKFSCVRLGS